MGRKFNFAIYFIILIILLIFGYQQCNNTKTIIAEVTNVNQDSVKYYRELVNGKNKEIAYQRTALSITKEGLNARIEVMEKNYRDLASRKNSFKQIDNATGMVNNFDADTMRFAMKEIPCLEKPDTMNVDTSFVKLNMIRFKKLLTINKLFVPDTVTTITGLKKTAWYKKNEYRTEVSHSNPKVQTVNLEAVAFHPEKKWHETRGFNMGVGAVLLTIVFGLLR